MSVGGALGRISGIVLALGPRTLKLLGGGAEPVAVSLEERCSADARGGPPLLVPTKPDETTLERKLRVWLLSRGLSRQESGWYSTIASFR